jgi:hypothetical protein
MEMLQIATAHPLAATAWQLAATAWQMLTGLIRRQNPALRQARAEYWDTIVLAQPR